MSDELTLESVERLAREDIARWQGPTGDCASMRTGVVLARAYLAERGFEKECYNCLKVNLDLNRLRSGGYRALHAEHQWLFDILRERDELRAKLDAERPAGG